MIACGTAHHAGMIAKYWLERIARVPVEADIASEFRYRAPAMPRDGAALVISQSGETADTLAALRYCREAGQKIIAVVNQPESSIAREADIVLPTLAGPEIGVASTKAFTTQLAVLAAFTVAMARARGTIDADGEAALAGQLAEIPSRASEVLHHDERLREIAEEIAQARDVLYLGRGTSYPLALEGALKLKEISYIHAEGYAAGEMKHGPIALIDDAVPVIVLAPPDDLFEKTLSNVEEVMARGGRVVMISDQAGVARLEDRCAFGIAVPQLRPVRRAAALRDPDPAPRLPRRGAERHRRRPAAQSREKRHGRVTRAGRVSPARVCQYRRFRRGNGGWKAENG